MCGIYGIVNVNNQIPKNELESRLIKNINLLNHRGPDDSGIWIDKKVCVGLAHRRLSILDLSENGRQPMISSNGNYVISYNGEIYNYLEIKKLLEEEYNVKFKTKTDTEVILEAISQLGIIKTLKMCDGMFAIAIWDRKQSNLYLSRDRIGEKPLYYYKTNNTLIFTSELKTILKDKLINKRINLESLNYYTNYNYIPGEKTILESTFKVLPGTLLKVSLDNKSNINESIQQVRYWSYNSDDKNNSYSEVEALIETEKLITESLKKRIRSDVPIGCFLSSGVDSALLASILQNKINSKPLNTFTIGFKDSSYNEARDAKNISNILGTNHNEVYLTNYQLLDIIPALPNIYDEPFADSSQIPTTLLCQVAKNNVKVCISGDGGDELFGGYNRYTEIKKYYRIYNKVQFLRNKNIHNLIFNTFTDVQLDTFFEKLGIKEASLKINKISTIGKSASIKQAYFDLLVNKNANVLLSKLNKDISYNHLWSEKLDFANQMMTVDAKTYLPDDILVKVDRASMINSLEVRVPFLSKDLIEFTSQMPTKYKIKKGNKKWVLKKILKKYLPKKIVENRKSGFSVPLDSWLRNELKPWLCDTLNTSRIIDQNIYSGHAVNNLVDDHLNKKSNNKEILWNILMFQEWYKKYF
jgi:asparagine synthase (glutamine-hydrolysing)